jgi:chemotaxis protein MotB
MAGHKAKVEKDSAERWLLTYADLMNLLLILFIILYAMSQLDSAKYNQLARSLSRAFGDSSAASYIGTTGMANSIVPLESDGFSSTVIPTSLEAQQMQAVEQKVTELVASENLKGSVDVTMEERGIVISIRAQVLFKSGSSDIEATSVKTVESIGKVLLSIPGNQIKIEGHTDNDPITTSLFPSNWELSSVRATNVLRLLVDKAGINPKMISAVGYGEFRPKVPNTTAENKAINRRVNIVIVKSMYNPVEGNSPTAAPQPSASDTGSSQPGSAGTVNTQPAASDISSSQLGATGTQQGVSSAAGTPSGTAGTAGAKPGTTGTAGVKP